MAAPQHPVLDSNNSKAAPTTSTATITTITEAMAAPQHPVLVDRPESPLGAYYLIGDPLPAHPVNNLPITEVNPVDMAQIQFLSLRGKINPFEFIRAGTRTEAKDAIVRLANEAGSVRMTIFNPNTPRADPLEPPLRADGTPQDRPGIAIHYRTISNYERANQFLLIACILAVDPSQLDKSYTAIMISSFRRWIERVKRFAVEAAASRVTPSVLEVKARILDPKNRPDDVAYYWQQFSLLANEKIIGDTRNNINQQYATEDEVGKNMLKGRYSCEILKEWTVAWERERADFENSYMTQAGNVDLAAPALAVPPHIDPRTSMR